MNGNWQAAVDVRGELARYYRSDEGRIMAEGFARSSEIGRGPAFLKSIRYLLDKAEATYWVSEDVLDVARFAAESLPRFELRPDDLMTPSGFLLFEDDQYILDIHDRPMGFRAVAWGVSGDLTGLGYVLFASKWAEHDWHNRFSRGLPVDPPPSPKIVEYGDPDPPAPSVFEDVVYRVPHDKIPPWTVCHFDKWAFGDTYADLDERIRQSLTRRERYGHIDFTEEKIRQVADHERGFRSFMLACWLLMQQPVVLNTEGRLQRQTERRRQRDPVTRAHPDRVQVITLRRPAEPRDRNVEHTGRHLTTRHVRRGFWREQWYASEGRHKPLWIEATVVGPEGAPLIQRHKVFQWTR